MKLELAESPLAGKMAVNRISGKMAVNKLTDLFLCVPHPRDELPPIFVRADLLRQLNEKELNFLLSVTKDVNTPENINLIRDSLGMTNFLRDESDGTDYVETANTVVTIIDTVISWFDGGSGSGNGSPAPIGSIIGFTGFIAAGLSISGQMVLFGVHPTRRAIIAFSTPEHFRSYFPNIPNGYGTPTFPATPLPTSLMPSGMLEFSLSHPDQVIKEKSGGGFEVVAGSHPVGWDNNGNPGVYPPPITEPLPGSESGSGITSLLPLAIAAYFITS